MAAFYKPHRSRHKGLIAYLDSDAVYKLRQTDVEGDYVDGEGRRYAVKCADVLFADGLVDVERMYVAIAERSSDVRLLCNIPYFSCC